MVFNEVEQPELLDDLRWVLTGVLAFGWGGGVGWW
jgi:hypothetical protein